MEDVRPGPTPKPCWTVGQAIAELQKLPPETPIEFGIEVRVETDPKHGVYVSMLGVVDEQRFRKPRKG